MYWKINFSNHPDRCIRCCKQLIEKKIDIIQKKYDVIIVKTDVSYTDLLNICLYYDVINVKSCYIRNWLERNFKNGQLRNTSKN